MRLGKCECHTLPLRLDAASRRGAFTSSRPALPRAPCSVRSGLKRRAPGAHSESLYDDEKFESRGLAALVASKVYYHLEELDDALRFALCAGEVFNVAGRTEYVETLLAKCIDEYIRLRSEAAELKIKGEEPPAMDPRLEAIVERMFQRCFDHGQYEQALGIAVESRRLDRVAQCITRSGKIEAMLSYCYQLCKTVVQSRRYRNQLLTILVGLYKGLEVPDYLSMCQCLLFLNDSDSVAVCLDKLIRGDTKSAVMAYQVAFDLNENQNQPFLLRVRKRLGGGADGKAQGDSEGKDAGEAAAAGEKSSGSDAMEVETTDAAGGSAYGGRLAKLKDILSGKTPTSTYLQFLYEHTKSDLLILQQIKEKLKPRNTVTHIATVMSHAIMNSGTTVDTFLRDNLKWLAKATNWSKFTTVASFGVIHHGHHAQSRKLLDPYINSGANRSPYQEGGALYGLGLIHACDGGEQAEFLKGKLETENEIVQHGASLGLGLTAMATGDLDLYEMLFEIVVRDNAVSGEAAAVAAGLVMLGTGHEDSLENLVTYARETEHEKIKRGISLAVALIEYGREEAADPTISMLAEDKDPILRYGAMHTIALAYVGTGNNRAVRRLLHVAVSDVSDDVRRAAVTAIGFVLCSVPEKVPTIVSLLAEGFNPHVRYGAALAVGIACAGTGSKAALDLLESLNDDLEDFVRQGAYIATAMVLIQHNKTKEPRVEAFRKRIDEALWAKGDTMAKFGAIIAAGIIDAGGRNATISLLSAHGHKKMKAIVGMIMFPQFWYWHPFIHMICMSFTPTAIIGLTPDPESQELKIPQGWAVKSNARPSLFAYPAPRTIKKEEKKELKTATLSVTAKAKKKAKKKAEASSADSMDVDGEDAGPKDPAAKDADTKMQLDEDEAKAKAGSETKMDVDGAADEAAGDEKGAEDEKKAPEPEFELLTSPSRVTWAQQAVIEPVPGQRYRAAKDKLSGIVMLIDTKPSEEVSFVAAKPPKLGVPGVSDDEPDPPKPFEFKR